MREKEKMRYFDSGASRNDDTEKLDFEGFFHPLVLEAYGKYMHRHRKQADGKLRDSDNWQKFFGKDHYSVCMKSMWRHFMDVWKEHRGFKSREGILDGLMGIIFNAMAYAYKLLKEKSKED